MAGDEVLNRHIIFKPAAACSRSVQCLLTSATPATEAATRAPRLDKQADTTRKHCVSQQTDAHKATSKGGEHVTALR